MSKNIVVKVGGAYLNQNPNNEWLKDVVELKQRGHRVIVVHGGGPYITKALADSGVQTKFHEGQRITTPEEIKILEQVLSHELNRALVDAVMQLGEKAIGISGVDGEILFCDYFNKDLGQVGKVEKVNSQLLSEMSVHGVVVMSPVGVRGAVKFNVNADVAAAAVAKSLPDAHLVFLTGTEGLLGKNGELVSSIHRCDIEPLIADNVIQGGMIVKVRMIEDVLSCGSEVAILNGQKDRVLFNYIEENRCCGTQFLS